MAPVILKTDVRCLRRARRIRDAVRSMHGTYYSCWPGLPPFCMHARLTFAWKEISAGVEDVRVSVDTGLVVVAGASLDASLLRRRIQSRTRMPVAIVSDGGAAEEPPAGQMLHMGPTPPLGYPYPYTYGGYGGYGGGWPAPPLQYVPGGNVFPYDYDARQYGMMMMANDAPASYRDDGPSGCCTMQ